MQAAIEALQIVLEVLEINAPINENEGNFEQARFERERAVELRAAIMFLESGL